MSEDSYWLTKAAEAEAELESIRLQFEEMKRAYNQRIDELERILIQANSEIMNYRIQVQESSNV